MLTGTKIFEHENLSAVSSTYWLSMKKKVHKCILSDLCTSDDKSSLSISFPHKTKVCDSRETS